MESLALAINSKLYPLYLRLLGKSIFCDDCRIDPTVLFSIKRTGTISIGKNSEFRRGAVVVSHEDAHIKIGANCSLNHYAIVYGAASIEIGDYSRIATHCVIASSDHVFKDRNTPIKKQGMESKPIKIGADVWLGSSVQVLGGSIIGEGCVVGAGSVVKGTLEPYGVYVGVPARKIGERS